MDAGFFDIGPEDQIVLRIDATTLCEAERLIQSCEFCYSEGAQIAFVVVLDEITGSDPTVTDYLLEHPAKCPKCRRDILEKTLVQAA